MHRSSLIAGFVLVAACSTSESRRDDPPPLESGSFTTCGAPTPTGDGAFVLYSTCRTVGQGQQIAAVPVAGGPPRRLAALSTDELVMNLGATGSYAYWTVRHTSDGSADLTVVDLKTADALSATTFRLGTGVGMSKDVLISESGKVVALLTTTAGVDRLELVVGRLTDRRPIYRGALPRGAFQIWPSHPDHGYALVETVSDAPRLARLDLLDSGPVLSPFVRPQLQDVELIPESFDGIEIVARFTKQTDGLTRIDVASGRDAYIMDGVDHLTPIAVNNDNVWYTAERIVGGVRTNILERAPRSPSAIAMQTLESSAEPFWARMSADKEKILVRRGADHDVNELALIAASGDLPETTIVPKSNGSSVAIASELQPRAKHVLFTIEDKLAYEERAILVDDATGVVAGEWQQGVDYDSRQQLELPANGESVYLARSCTVEAKPGREVLQLFPSALTVRGCTEGDGGVRLPIPKSNALILASDSGLGASTFTVLRP